MLVGETKRRARAICTMVNRGLEVLNIEARLFVDARYSTINAVHTYANGKCIDIEKPTYTFPISILDK